VAFWAVARTPLGIALAAYFGLQSLQAYAIFGWFAQLWRDNGYSAGTAGLLVGLLTGVTIPLSYVLPRILVASRRPAVVTAPGDGREHRDACGVQQGIGTLQR